MNPQLQTQPKAQPVQEIKIQDVITLTARLAQLLAEEADLLGAMKIKQIEKLQHEKIFITNALEAQRKLIDKYPYSVGSIPSQDREDLEGIMEVFHNVLAENHRKLLLAKEVNHKIVSAIKEVVRDHSSSRTYSGDGVTHYAPYETISVTLDSKV